MKRKFSRLGSLCMAVSLLFSFTACTSKPADASTPPASTSPAASENAPAEEITLTISHSAFMMPNELEKPESEWEINKLFRKFEEANPGVKIVSQYNSDEAANQNKLKAAVLAGNAPDIINMYSGYLPTSLKDVLLDITPYVPKEDLEIITGWQTVRQDLKADGAILGYPAGGPEIGCLVYNKKLVAAAGVDLEGDARPKTAAEFAEALKKIKATGVLPIVARDDGYNKLWMFPLGAWWTQYVGSERVNSNSMGITKFADDAAFIKTLDFASQLYKDELINKDYTTIADASMVFFNGQAAMMATGNWDLQNVIDQLGDDAGIYTVPSFDTDVKYPEYALGGVGQALCVVNTCKNPEMAVKFLSFFNNKENVLQFSKMMTKIPQRTDITAEELGWVGKPLFEKTLKIADHLFGWNDNAMQPDVMNEYYVQSTLALTGKITAEECAKLLDKKAAEVNK